MSSARSVAVVINPVSGTRGRADVARRRAVMAADLLGHEGIEPRVFVTEGAGHARELALGEVARGIETVVAWGGDGTVNEVASALAFTPTALAIVPSGSGNGLARELGLPSDPVAALRLAIGAGVRLLDMGELDTRLFVNVAGLGLDARVAHRFAAAGTRRRGLLRYVQLTARELFTFESVDQTIDVDGTARTSRALLVAIANSRQYGNGAVIAPDARVDDGRLDVVVIDDRARLLAALQVPRVFLGQVTRVSGVSVRQGVQVTISAAVPLAYHVDGEPFTGGCSMTARIRPSALWVRSP